MIKDILLGAYTEVPVSGSGTGDQNWNNVTLLLNGDDLSDHSASPVTLSNVGNVTINTTTKKYGSGSMSFSSNYLQISQANVGSRFTFGTADFTIEAWIYPNSAANFICEYIRNPQNFQHIDKLQKYQNHH